MKYDPVKKQLGNAFNKSPFLRKFFYGLLDVLLLRTWHIKRAIKHHFSDRRKESLQVLDAGMGFGQYSYYLSRKFRRWSIKGVDVKEEQVADCNSFFAKIKLKNASFAAADLTRLDEKEKYDFILSVDVMEHIEDDNQVLTNFYQAMRTGGMLLISTPSDQGGSDVHHHDDEDEHSFVDEHVRNGYNINAIQVQLKKAGFSTTKALYTYGTPGKISWKLSMKFPILMLNVSKLFFILLPVYYLVFFPLCLILNVLDVHCSHRTGTGLVVKAWKNISNQKH
ncbi:MAG: class I SAM-dependent methyltransferase [Bacteroidales bacterium]|nr:class I SAM-dependent methyltransferase [Bacteroidales bacterium]